MAKYYFAHVHLMSADTVRAAEFYEEMLGATRERTLNRDDGRTDVYLDLDGVKIAIMPTRPQAHFPMVPSPSETVLEHLAVTTDDLDAAVKELRAKGVTVEDPYEFRPGVWVTHLLGPDNMRIELAPKRT